MFVWVASASQECGNAMERAELSSKGPDQFSNSAHVSLERLTLEISMGDTLIPCQVSWRCISCDGPKKSQWKWNDVSLHLLWLSVFPWHLLNSAAVWLLCVSIQLEFYWRSPHSAYMKASTNLFYPACAGLLDYLETFLPWVSGLLFMPVMFYNWFFIKCYMLWTLSPGIPFKERKIQWECGRNSLRSLYFKVIFTTTTLFDMGFPTQQ